MDPTRSFAELDPAGPPRLVWLRSPAGDGTTVALAGAFDPPTNAHLQVLAAAARWTGLPGSLLLTKVLLDRPPDLLLPMEDRLLLLQGLADDHDLGFAVCNRGTYLEMTRASDRPIVFVVGSDKLPRLEDPSWYPDGEAGVEATRREVRLVVVPRPGHPVLRDDVAVLEPGEVFDDPATSSLSATDVRTRLRRGEDVSKDLPTRVGVWLRGYNQDPSRHR
ncbi:MAG TPA: hypothetical protein VM840_10690 [Actinomycetota bacterium]|nr:hypothetical protein [Actinomycetota bacterium]